MLTSIWNDTRSGGGTAQPGHRSVFQQDYDRVLFSTPVRRLADKTQVFPLDKNDSVRTRLTHSHEVANLAKSIGSRLAHEKHEFGAPDTLERSVLPILSTIGLAHDLGNPPFGHRGEAAIQDWFLKNSWIFTHRSKDKLEQLQIPVDVDLRREFTGFDGNPQTLRLLTRLQTSPVCVGLDLSFATLAASTKYPVGVRSVDKSRASAKKVGYFESERSLIDSMRAATGLQEGQRHPLTWIMEACDDIAYSVLDVEDSIKKHIISPGDILNILTRECKGEIVYRLQDKFDKAEATGRPTSIIRDMKAGYFRASAIDALIDHACFQFREVSDAINNYSDVAALMDTSPLCKVLKSVAAKYAFGNSEVLRAEAEGARALTFLMDCFWSAIANRSDDDIGSTRSGANDRFAFSLISPNYVDAAHNDGSKHCTPGLCTRYREMRLLTDMISGMTDTFCIDLAHKMRPLYQ